MGSESHGKNSRTESRIHGFPSVEVTRREFLAAAAASVHAPWLAFAANPESVDPGLIPGGPATRVIAVQSRDVVGESSIHKGLLREMLRYGLTSLTSKPTEGEAWSELLSRNDLVGLKFNRSGQGIISTTPAIAEAVIMSLLESGWSPSQLVCIEAPSDSEQTFGTLPAAHGFSRESIDFGSGTDQFAEVLNQVDAIINVPFLKTHNIAGLTACLKNLSHGLIRHPARFHGKGCSPYIADIVAVPRIRSKLRLCLVDALRVVFAEGPVPRPETMAVSGTLLFSTDPVAADTVAFDLLNRVRRQMSLEPIAVKALDVPYLKEAQALGLGAANPYTIQRINHAITG